MKARLGFFLLCFAFFLVASTSAFAEPAQAAEAQKPPAFYKVKETFNVGDNVVVRSLSFNRDDESLWIGTSVGILMVDTKTGNVIRTITRDNGLANEYVFASAVAKNKDVWFGTNGGGVSRLTAEGWKTYFPMHGLADYWVYSFVEQTDEAMWIGTWAGLSRFDYRTNSFTNYLKELVNEWVYGLDVDKQGRLWIATEGGVNMFDGSAWHVWTHADGLGAANDKKLPFSTNTGLGTRVRHDLSVMQSGLETYNPNYVFCIKVAPDGSVWAGTWGGGVSHFDGKKWRNFTELDGLAGNIVYSIEINAKEFWFGTNKGVSRFDGKNWLTLGAVDGLLDSNVYAIVKDDTGKIWVGTRNGVAVIESQH